MYSTFLFSKRVFFFLKRWRIILPVRLFCDGGSLYAILQRPMFMCVHGAPAARTPPHARTLTAGTRHGPRVCPAGEQGAPGRSGLVGPRTHAAATASACRPSAPPAPCETTVVGGHWSLTHWSDRQGTRHSMEYSAGQLIFSMRRSNEENRNCVRSRLNVD